MKDQNSIDGKETPSQKYERALDLFTESVLKPDHDFVVVHTIKVVMMNSWKLENM